MKASLITVLVPVYNADKYVSEAIDCILQQTFEEFELLWLKDGSTDNIKEIIQSRKIAALFIEDKTNQGLIKTLNKGLFLSKGKIYCQNWCRRFM